MSVTLPGLSPTSETTQPAGTANSRYDYTQSAGVIAMLACGGHICQDLFLLDKMSVQNQLPETHKELALNVHNRHLTMRVYKWNCKGQFGSYS